MKGSGWNLGLETRYTPYDFIYLQTSARTTEHIQTTQLDHRDGREISRMKDEGASINPDDSTEWHNAPELDAPIEKDAAPEFDT